MLSVESSNVKGLPADPLISLASNINGKISYYIMNLRYIILGVTHVSPGIINILFVPAGLFVQ